MATKPDIFSLNGVSGNCSAQDFIGTLTVRNICENDVRKLVMDLNTEVIDQQENKFR